MTTVEETLGKLEAILQQLSGSEVTLEESIALYAKAAELLAQSNERIKNAQVKIEKIDEKMQQLRFDDDI